MKPKPPEIEFDDDPAAPQIFCDDIFGYWAHDGVATLTMTAAQIDHESPPNRVKRRVVARVVVPLPALKRLSEGLGTFLKQLEVAALPRPPDDKLQ